MFNDQKVTSKVEIFELENFQDDLFKASLLKTPIRRNNENETNQSESRLDTQNSSAQNEGQTGVMKNDNSVSSRESANLSHTTTNDKQEMSNIQKLLSSDGQSEENKGDQSEPQPEQDVGTKIGEFSLKTEFTERILKSIDIDKE